MLHDANGTTLTTDRQRARRSDPKAVRRRVDSAGPAYRVLIADDQPSVRAALTRILVRLGFEVTQMSDGPSALATARSMLPDLVLLDGSMPGCDGYEVCRQLKSDSRTALIPVVIITGDGGVADRVRGAEVGADAFFTKPFEVT